jgi:hypothetical protein
MTETATARHHDDVSEHSDIDIDNIDIHLHRMSVDAMKILESITDEVNEIGKGNSSRDPSSSPPSKKGKLEPSMMSDGKPVTPSPDQKPRHMDDLDLGGDDDDDDDDMSDDGSLAQELSALRSVAMEIERELSTQDVGTMQKAISGIESSSDPRKRMLNSDDKEIIRRILDDEMKKYVPKNSWERFMKRYHLEGISEQDKTYFLAPICTLVCSIFIRLVYKVMYGEI